VIDSRVIDEGKAIRRRRECLKCHHRFTTYEEFFEQELRVVKKDGRHEKFLRQKIRDGIARACEKRPVSGEQVDRMTNEVIRDIQGRFDREISSRSIGECIMKKLRQEDEIAYIRYASVYRQFRNVEEFIKEVQTLAG
jgi:transcriptional repressor NrdR